MARPISRKSSLVRLFDDWDSPVCLLDADRRVVFCNQQLADRLGGEIDEVLGQICQYHSEPGRTAVADRPPTDVSLTRLPNVHGLCPPRHYMDARFARGHVRLLADPQVSTQETAAFPASFHTLLNRAGEMIGILIVVEPVAEQVARSLVDAESLHDEIWRLRHALRADFQIDHFVGNSPAIRRVRQQMELAAGVQASVVVTGPPGSGRAHVARTIHALSDPKHVSMILPLSASVLDPESLSNTVDALLQRCAALDLPNTATLLVLDSDQLSEAAQEALLSILGSHGAELRMLATAQRALIDLAKQTQFSNELAERLSTVVVNLPPLSERPQDVPLLAQYFVERHNAGVDRARLRTEDIEQFAGFAETAMEQLIAYAWPGNVDELQDVVRQCLEQSEPPMINVAQLPHRVRAGIDAALNPIDKPASMDLESHLADIERELIKAALARAGGNKTQAAKSLQVSRAKLLRRMEQLQAD